MTTEEKAKAYDKALEEIQDYIKSLKNVNDGIWSARDIENSLSEIFPQLKESEGHTANTVDKLYDQLKALI